MPAVVLLTLSLTLLPAGVANARSGTISFRGAVTGPTCDFEPAADALRADCVMPSGKTTSAALNLARADGLSAMHAGTAEVRVEPVRTVAGTARSGRPAGYVVMATYP